MMQFVTKELRLYITERGECPYEKWLSSIRDVRARSIVRTRITRLRLGNFGDCKPVGAGVFELRVHYGPGYRIYFGNDENTVIILLCGGAKHTQPRDIETAQRFWSDYRMYKHGKKQKL